MTEPGPRPAPDQTPSAPGAADRLPELSTGLDLLWFTGPSEEDLGWLGDRASTDRVDAALVHARLAGSLAKVEALAGIVPALPELAHWLVACSPEQEELIITRFAGCEWFARISTPGDDHSGQQVGPGPAGVIMLCGDSPAPAAVTVTVVTIAAEHRLGGLDYLSTADRMLAASGRDASGELVTGVGRAELALSQQVPPEPVDWPGLNAAALERARRWTPSTASPSGLVAEPVVDLYLPVGLVGDARGPRGARSVSGAISSAAPAPALEQGLRILCCLAVIGGVIGRWPWLVALGLLGLLVTAWWQGRRLLAEASRPAGLAQLTEAVIAGLRAGGRLSAEGGAVQQRVLPEGGLRVHLAGLPEPQAAAFAAAMAELVVPDQPRLLIERWQVGRTGPVAATLAGWGLARPGRPAWWPVPAAIGSDRRALVAFTAAWGEQLGGGSQLDTRSVEGRRALAARTAEQQANGARAVLRTRWVAGGPVRG